MSLKSIFILLVCSGLLCQNVSCQSPAADSSKQSSLSIESKTRTDSLLDEVNSSFTIDGKPINPRVIHDLAGGAYSMSDGPIITSLNLGMANKSNRYFCDTCLGKYNIDYGRDKDGRSQGNFSYSYLGKTPNNIHVIRTHANGGGSGNWSFILFLSVHVRTAYVSGVKQEQLIMNLEGSALGSYGSGVYGTSSKVVVKHDKIIIDYVTNRPDENGKEVKTEAHKEFWF